MEVPEKPKRVRVTAGQFNRGHEIGVHARDLLAREDAWKKRGNDCVIVHVVVA